LAVAENIRYDSAGAAVRGGMKRQFSAGAAIGKIYGAAVFKPEADEDYLALATQRYLVLFNQQTQTIQYFSYPSGEQIDAGDAVDLVQAGVGVGVLPALYILRGQSKSVLVYDAAAGTVTVAAGFQAGDFALFYQDRMAVANRQSVHLSDFLDFATFTLLNQFQILKGGDDYLQAFVPYQKDYVLIGTRQGWYIAFFDPTVGTGGYSGAVKDSSFLRALTSEAGPVGPEAAIEAMGAIWFISGGAIYAFQPQLDNQLVVLGKPLSAEIQPIMDRMCVRYARRASVERYGYRLYFALPISDVPVAVSSVSVVEKLTVGLELPFDLPAILSKDAIATVTTAAAHNLAAGDQVQLSGAADAVLNGEFQVALNVSTAAAAGSRMKIQKLATRNNCIAVFNLNNKAWESIDWLPSTVKADWLRPVEHAASRRLMVVDDEAGPFLYEEGGVDEVGDVYGGISLPFGLPIELSQFNYVTQPVRTRFLTRAYRWGINPRRVTQCEVRATLDAESAVTLTLRTNNPNRRIWSASRQYTGNTFDFSDAPLRKLCGERALEAQVEIQTSGGSPTFRSVAVETLTVGKVEQ
jgi:hypothetical protein